MLPFRTADPQSHKFVPAGATRPPTRQQIGHQVVLPPPPLWSVFGQLFGFCLFFFGIMRFYVNPRSLKILLFLFWSLATFLHRFVGSLRTGGGDPVGKLERTRGAAAHVYNAYRDRHPGTTQNDKRGRRSGSKARSCG